MDEDRPKKYFATVDILVFTGMLGVSGLVGIYFAYKARNSTEAVREYLMGGKRMSIFPISMSLIAR